MKQTIRKLSTGDNNSIIKCKIISMLFKQYHYSLSLYNVHITDKMPNLPTYFTIPNSQINKKIENSLTLN